MSQPTEKIAPFRAVNVPLSGSPLDPDSMGTIIKPGELVDIVELSPLTLTDRRVYNLLLAHAWPSITENKVHKIEKAALKGAHQSNDRLEDSINRLMGTIVIVKRKNGKRTVREKSQLLGPNTEEVEERGYLHYTFPVELLKLIRDSSIYARLKSHIMYCFSSKYSLCLYEMIEKRKNLEYTQSETFELDDLRELLNVPKGKLERFGDFNRRVLQAAIEEVNALADFSVFVTPIKSGKRVTSVRVMWCPKDETGKRLAFEEMERHRAGRKARIKGTVERIDTAITR